MGTLKNNFMSELKKFKDKHGDIFENKTYQQLKDDENFNVDGSSALDKFHTWLIDNAESGDKNIDRAFEYFIELVIKFSITNFIFS